MAFSESVLVAMFCISVVFAVLISLFAIIRVFSVVISILSRNKLNSLDSEVSTFETDAQNETEEFSSGVLNLKDVDEQTAAIIMAIVSDKSEISLSELCFKSIRLIKE